MKVWVASVWRDGMFDVIAVEPTEVLALEAIGRAADDLYAEKLAWFKSGFSVVKSDEAQREAAEMASNMAYDAKVQEWEVAP